MPRDASLEKHLRDLSKASMSVVRAPMGFDKSIFVKPCPPGSGLSYHPCDRAYAWASFSERLRYTSLMHMHV